MSTVYLHIGMPKTGTTAIQCFLTDNTETLSRYHICFPDFNLRYYRIGYRRNAHFLALPYVDESGLRDELRPCSDYAPAMDQIEALGKEYDKIILADEALWRSRSNQPDFWMNFKNDLAGRGLELRIIIYLRRQDAYLESLYRQKIKEYATRQNFHDYLKHLNDVDYPLDYSSNLDMLSDIVGKENLFIRIYEKGQYKGAEKNLFSDFLDIFGLSLQDGFEIKQAAHNISIDGTRLTIQRILNALSEPPNELLSLDSGLHSLQHFGVHAADDFQTTLFEPGEAAEFLGKYAASNQRIAREYLNREDGVLFYDTEIRELPQHSLDAEDLLQDTILFFGSAVQELEHQNRALQAEIDQLRRDFSSFKDNNIVQDIIYNYEKASKYLKPKIELEKNVDGLKKDLKKLQGDFREVRENVLLYRLRRKIRHLSGKDNPV